MPIDRAGTITPGSQFPGSYVSVARKYCDDFVFLLLLGNFPKFRAVRGMSRSRLPVNTDCVHSLFVVVVGMNDWRAAPQFIFDFRNCIIIVDFRNCITTSNIAYAVMRAKNNAAASASFKIFLYSSAILGPGELWRCTRRDPCVGEIRLNKNPLLCRYRKKAGN